MVKTAATEVVEVVVTVVLVLHTPVALEHQVKVMPVVKATTAATKAIHVEAVAVAQELQVKMPLQLTVLVTAVLA